MGVVVGVAISQVCDLFNCSTSIDSALDGLEVLHRQQHLCGNVHLRQGSTCNSIQCESVCMHLSEKLWFIVFLHMAVQNNVVQCNCRSMYLQVISYLQGQRARHEILSMLLEVELRHHRLAHRLLAATQMQLSQWKRRSDERVVRNSV